ncbi:MAG TPA: HD domain-containing phosphohydrolase [Candidatus Cloacimonas sp.]|nr:HD domain-containing phosphohydrolase [Candidatus Cloacimonas sp.]
MNYIFSSNYQINKMLNNVVESITNLAEEQLLHIQRLTRIGESLSSETDLDKIFDMILEEGISFTRADAATIYMVNQDATQLHFEIVYNATLNLRKGGTRGPVNWKSIDLYDEEHKPVDNKIVTNVYHHKQGLYFDDVYEAEGYDVSGTIKTDKENNYRCKSMLTIPLKNHEDTVLGVIQFINAMDTEGNIISFTDEHKAMLSSLASQAAIALSNKKLIESLEELLNQFIRSIAGAIERKSKYSSNHITRVALLTEMLANKINEAGDNYFQGRKFSENELKEISMAGWMHDVGKIVTPEAIMDKSTKLETICDRIELIKLRLEKMELLLKYLQTQLTEYNFAAFVHNNIDSEMEPADFKNYFADITNFLVKLNEGKEFVDQADLIRVEKISNINFEYEGNHYFVFTENEKKNMMIPGRGTLTTEEMKIMQDHVAITWEMLSKLSFPKKYENVAFYASTHHEALNGKGYPNGYKAENLPLQSRILAVADIFEALTATDRPYKPAKTLSESLTIMGFMVKDGHLDKNLVDFFMDSGLYKEYAERYMDKKYIDEVNIESIKAKYANK